MVEVGRREGLIGILGELSGPGFGLVDCKLVWTLLEGYGRFQGVCPGWGWGEDREFVLHWGAGNKMIIRPTNSAAHNSIIKHRRKDTSDPL